MHNIRLHVQHRLWVAAYELEERRSLHGQQRRYLRSAACCIGLAFMQALRRLR